MQRTLIRLLTFLLVFCLAVGGMTALAAGRQAPSGLYPVLTLAHRAALVNATGKQVNLKVVVDPSVIGGLVATVGDTVIDGSVRTRIDQLKSRL